MHLLPYPILEWQISSSCVVLQFPLLVELMHLLAHISLEASLLHFIFGNLSNKASSRKCSSRITFTSYLSWWWSYYKIIRTSHSIPSNATEVSDKTEQKMWYHILCVIDLIDNSSICTHGGGGKEIPCISNSFKLKLVFNWNFSILTFFFAAYVIWLILLLVLFHVCM